MTAADATSSLPALPSSHRSARPPGNPRWRRALLRFVACAMLCGALVVLLLCSTVLAAESAGPGVPAGAVTINLSVLVSIVSLVSTGGIVVYSYAILGGTVRQHDKRLACLDSEDGLTVRVARIEVRMESLERQGLDRQALLAAQAKELGALARAMERLASRLPRYHGADEAVEP